MYTSIKINTGTSEVGSLIGVKIPSTLGRIEKDKTYTLQFKYIPLDNHTNLDRVKVGNQLFEPININDFDTVFIEENIEAKLCYITFISSETITAPSIEIARLRDVDDVDDNYTCEITDICLSYGVLSAYTQNIIDLSATKTILESKIKSVAEGLQFVATKKDLDQVSNKVSEVFGQIDVQAGDISLKVGKDNVISSINMTPENIKINTKLLDLSGDLDLQGQFKCWKNNSNKNSDYLHMNGAMMFGYNKTGGSYPVFASGLWTDENIGYVSVGYTRADVTDENGCLYMSPVEGNQGGRLTFSRLKNSQVAHTTLYFQKDGAIDFYSGLRGLYENDDNYTYRFDAGVSVKALRCNRIRSYDIYPRGNNTYDIGFTNGGNFENIWGNNICTNQSHLYLGTAQASGAWSTYGALAINSNSGYIFPAKYNGAFALGMTNNRFSSIYSINSVSVSSDSRLKTDIHYLDEPIEELIVLENRVERNMHITTKDMYDFVKDELKLASYRYNVNLERGNTSVDYGFIAQDILYTKVGSEIVQLTDKNDLNSELSYNQGNYISVIAGALQQEILKRDQENQELREEVEELKSQVNTLLGRLDVV